jgi:hypothetical protein
VAIYGGDQLFADARNRYSPSRSSNTAVSSFGESEASTSAAFSRFFNRAKPMIRSVSRLSLRSLVEGSMVRWALKRRGSATGEELAGFVGNSASMPPPQANGCSEGEGLDAVQ